MPRLPELPDGKLPNHVGEPKQLPTTGSPLASYGGSAAALVIAGSSLIALGRRRRTVAEAVADEFAPRWGTEPLIGW